MIIIVIKLIILFKEIKN